MKLTGVIAAAAALVPHAVAQVTGTYLQAGVPTAVPVPANYTGGLRPQVHYSPPQGFMNDPNGMHRDSNGTWHLYYQYNPTANVAGNQHWGHASSNDLYHWENQKIALYPVNASSYMFSGSAVIDKNNTSGFFPDQDNGVVAVYTLATYEPILLQTQALAYSRDGGYTFEQYSGNPVLDIGSSQFRDPYVMWYEDHWAMVVSYASDATIGVFTSPDLKSWTHASNFSHAGFLGVQYECPNLVEMPVAFANGTNSSMWLLQISINPGAPLGGSISQFFPGTFDGYTFAAIDRVARLNDFGKDNYAGQFFNYPGSGAVSIGWASNWEYAQTVPTGPLEGWRSAMAVPRENSLRELPNSDWALVSQPYDLSPVRGEQLAAKQLGNSSIALDFADQYSNALYFEANAPNVTAGTMNITFYSPISGESMTTGVTFGPANPVFVNRGNVRGFDNPYFTNSFSTHLVEAVTNVAGVFDRSMYELFLNKGQASATTALYPEQPLTLMSVSVGGILPDNATVSMSVWALNSAWQAMEGDSGAVLGNTTAASNSSNHKRHAKQLYAAEF